MSPPVVEFRKYPGSYVSEAFVDPNIGMQPVYVFEGRACRSCQYHTKPAFDRPLFSGKVGGTGADFSQYRRHTSILQFIHRNVNSVTVNTLLLLGYQ